MACIEIVAAAKIHRARIFGSDDAVNKAELVSAEFQNASENNRRYKVRNYFRSVAIVSIFSIVAFLGGFIKFGGAASIALDSWASFFVSAFFGPIHGALVGAFGHLLSATTGGFPFGPPVHLLVALMQFTWAALFGLISRRDETKKAWLLVGAVITVILNGVAGPLIIGTVFPQLTQAMHTLIPVLTLASVINVSIAALVYTFMKKGNR
jgi:uncharacterized membrane protein